MKVEIFGFCDFASADAGGKLIMIGVFDLVQSRELPATINLSSVVARFRFVRGDEGMRNISITLRDSEGNVIIPPIEAQIPVKIGSHVPTATAQVITTITLLRLPRYGEYTAELSVDGTPQSSCPIYVVPAIFPPQTQISKSE